jgi:hypothetical protein
MTCPRCQAGNPDAAPRCRACGREFELRRGVVLDGRYEILDTLGGGGMGIVFKAHDRELDEVVAVKVLRAEVAADPTMAGRFRSEIKLARKIRHPNVCAIHEYGQDGPIRFIVMEYVEGANLRDRLRAHGVCSPEEAVDFGLQIAAGLEAIHAQGIVHRDLKTPNVMVTAAGVLRLMDFGVAKRVEGATDAGATAVGLIVGTPDYMSPEQVRGESVDRRSDLYSLGIVLFELLTGELPFHAPTPFAIVMKQIHDAPPLDGPQAAGIPKPLLDLLRRLLAKERDARFQSATELIGVLSRVRDELGAPTLTLAAAVPRRDFALRVVLLGAAAGVFVVIAVAGWLAWRVLEQWPLSGRVASSTPAPAPSSGPASSTTTSTATTTVTTATTTTTVPVVTPPRPPSPAPPIERQTRAPRLEPTPANPVPSEVPRGPATGTATGGGSGGTVPVPLIAFEQGDTRYADAAGPAPRGFRPNSGGGEVHSTQPRIAKAQLVIEVDPRELRPGSPYKLRYYVFNRSADPLTISRVAIVRRTGAAEVTGGPVEPLAHSAPPAMRTLLVETGGTWNWDPATEWSTTLDVELDDGSRYTVALRTRRGAP